MRERGPAGSASEGASLFAAGVSFRTASLATREQMAVAPADRSEVARRLKSIGGLEEIVLLWTCNRVEIYGTASHLNGNIEAMFRELAPSASDLEGVLYRYEGEEAVGHLFSVTSGMDSMVVGETEITGQVKKAYEDAHAAGLAGRRTHLLFQKALKTAKEVRSRTAIGRGAASVGSVAVRHAEKVLGSSLRGRSVMVIGAGDMAEKCLRHLVKHGVGSIRVVNRSIDKAQLLASAHGGEAVCFGRCLEAMADMDIVITSTGCPHIVLERGDVESVMAGRPDRPLVIIDIAVPRDVAPEVREIPGVYLQDLSDLEGTVRENIRYRQQDLDLCRSIIGEKAAATAVRLGAAVPVCMGAERGYSSQGGTT